MLKGLPTSVEDTQVRTEFYKTILIEASLLVCLIVYIDTEVVCTPGNGVIYVLKTFFTRRQKI